MIESRGAWRSCRVRIGGIVLRNGLHRPFDGVAAGVLHRRVKADSRRIRIESNRALKLDASLGIGRASQFDLALVSFQKFAKRKLSVIDYVRVSHPMLFVAHCPQARARVYRLRS